MIFVAVLLVVAATVIGLDVYARRRPLPELPSFVAPRTGVEADDDDLGGDAA